MATAAMAAPVEVLKSPSDRKAYRYVKLGNGMSVLLVHDPEIAADAAARAARGEAEGMDADGGSASGSEGAESMSGSSSEGGSGEDEEEEEDEDEDEEGEEGDSMGTSGGSGEDESGSGEGEEDDEGEGGRGGRRKGKAGGGAPGASKKAAAAMAVGVGSFSDPPRLQGLSHYLEHMLFMGSEAFPDENEYDAFLTKHGGSSNAYTELEYTNYHFEVAPPHLRGALERFAQFFVAPLCKQSAMEREVCAVDSEFSGVRQDDHSRLCQLMCHTSKPGHVYSKFSWGNKKSLWDEPREAGLDVRSELLEYYGRQYGAERMCLAVLGGEPLDTLETWARDLFAGVKGGHCGPAPTFEGEGAPFEGGRMHIAPAVKEHHEVTVTFALPPLRRYYTTKPDHYISHLVGHEGPGSLLSALKSRGWVTDLCAGVEDDGYGANSCCYLFSVAMTLTEAGLNAGPGMGLAPVGLLFQYLRLLQQAGPQEWVWRELKAISDFKFRFLEDEDSCDYVTRLAATLGVVAPQHVLAADWLHEAWEPERVAQLLGGFSPGGGSYRVDLQTTDFKTIRDQLEAGSLPRLGGGAEGGAVPNGSAANGGGGGGRLEVFTEPWFGMDAAALTLPAALTAGWAEAAVAPDLGLPPPNPYIPSDFSLVDGGGGGDAAGAAAAAEAAAQGLGVVLATPPELVLDEPGLRLWHKLDARFRQPRGHCYVRLASAAGYASPRSAALTGLWLKLVEDALNEDAYMADVAGLHYSTSPEGHSGVELRVDGFSHKLPVLAARLMDCATRCEVRASSFGRIHEALSRKHRNANMAVGRAANYARLYALQANVWHVDAVAAALAGITDVEEVKAFVREFMASCHVEVFILGNVAAPAAADLARRLHAAAGPGAALPAASRPADRCVALPLGRALEHSQAAKNPEEENCCVEVYFQVGPASDLRLRSLLDLADQIVYEPCYDSLRTKQQLGYTVHSGSRLTHGVLGFCVVVVSAAYGVEHVEGRVEAFLASYRDALQAMPAEEFERHRAALISNKLTRDTALGQEGDRAWDAIWSGRHDFLAREQEAQVLQGASLAEVQALYDEYLWPLSPKRRKLSVRVIPCKGAAAPAPAGDAPPAAAAPQRQGARKRPPAAHVGHAHPHFGEHLLPPLGAGSPKAGSPRARRAKQQQQLEAAAAGGGGGSGGGAADAADAAPPPRLPVPTEAAPDLDALKRSLGTYPATLAVQPPAAAAGAGGAAGGAARKSVGLLRALHVEGLPLTMTASKLSELMSAYGPVQYAEAAPEVSKDDGGAVTGRRLHCYVVFADHTGACLAKRALQPRMPESPCTPASCAGGLGAGRAGSVGLASAPSSVDGSALVVLLGPGGQGGCSPRSSLAGDGLTPRWDALSPRAAGAPGDAPAQPALTPRASSAAGGSPRAPAAVAAADDGANDTAPCADADASGGGGADQEKRASGSRESEAGALDEAGSGSGELSPPKAPTLAPGDGAQPPPSPPPPAAADAAGAAAAPPLAPPPVLRVRFAKPQNVAAACTPAFRAFIAAQWAQASAIAKACPDCTKKPGCKVNALFISKLHQHITSARLQALFGKFGRMIACEVQYHSDGRSAGHGVVIYETIEDAERSLQTLNGYRLEGRGLEITPLRLKKLPSKLEHLKNRIKRLPGGPPGAGGEMSGSEDGTGGAGLFGAAGGLGFGSLGGPPGGGGLGALGLARALSASPRVSGAGSVGGGGGVSAAALNAHMAAAAAAASVAGGGCYTPPPHSPAGAMSALSALALSHQASLGAGGLGGGLGGFGGAQQAHQQQAAMAAAAAAAFNLQQHQQQQQLQAALATAHGMHPAAAAALLQAAASGGFGAPQPPPPSAAALQAQAALLHQQAAAQRALAAAAAAGLSPQQVAALSAALGGGDGGAGAAALLSGLGLHGQPPGGLMHGVPTSAPCPGLDLSFL
ncbi:MAG: Metalloenzyme, LuxS/M16 peptidase-like protein [Monoraphidium minutum]|nr:MAG: Metalloenzyme, LuxS/M16 peptidase-like protein [Monoraphidium minutum]